jgi:surfeit locus 1 family protein
MLQRMFSRKWLLTTILVIAAMAVMVRLGIWQLDRLHQRRLFNARVEAQIDQPALTLSGEALTSDLASMEYRPVIVSGEYDFAHEVALRNQAMNGQWGVDLITPLRIAGTNQAVLVNRGWIPGNDFESGNWQKYAEPGQVEIHGIIRDTDTNPQIGRRNDVIPTSGDPPLKAWNLLNVGGIAGQIPYPILPVYVQQAPDPAWTGLPQRSLPTLDLSEGPHMGYALQWFGFAALLGIGYPFYIRRQESLPGNKQLVSQMRG